MRRLSYLAAFTICLFLLSAVVGVVVGPSIVHPKNLNPERLQQTQAMLEHTRSVKQDFEVNAPDGVILRGWKVRPLNPNGDWVLLFHGVSDNRTGMLGAAEFLLRHHFSLVMMDSRAHGKSGGDTATFGWQERFDTHSIVQSLDATEQVRNLYAVGVSMGAAIALDSAAVEPQIRAVVAEAPFASLREVSYDYAGLDISPWIGKTIFRPGSYFGLKQVAKAGNFDPDEVSPEQAVAERAFPVLLICGTSDSRIPCRHAERIYRAAKGPKQLWIVKGADHAAVFGLVPRTYENRVVTFFTENSQPASR